MSLVLIFKCTRCGSFIEKPGSINDLKDDLFTTHECEDGSLGKAYLVIAIDPESLKRK